MKKLLLAFLFSCFAIPTAEAEPMPEATLEDYCNTAAIVEAEYVSYKPYRADEEISYFGTPLATYKVTKLVHGKTTPATLEVRYDFQNGSACLAPSDWKFSESLMPKRGSKWLLLLQEFNGGYATFRGDEGRKAIGEESAKFLSSCEPVWAKK